MRTKRKKCLFCGRYFVPNPRVGDRQRAFFREECKRERQARSWKRWFKKNPDYSRDGTTGIALFREKTGLWAIRGVTRTYFGGYSEKLVPGDYDGNGSRDIAVFRPSTGLWAVRGISRFYFGTTADIPLRGDYDGDNHASPGIFRGPTGLWVIRGFTRGYYGASGDIPVTR